MALRLTDAPWLRDALGYGVTVAVVLTVSLRSDAAPWWTALVVAGVSGVLVGAVVGVLAARRHRRLMNRVEGVPVEVLRAAMKTVREKSGAPSDPGVRAAAVQYVEHQLDELRRTRVPSVIVWTVVLGFTIWRALDSSPWWWVWAIFAADALVDRATEPERLRGRADAMRGEAPAP